MDQFRLRSEFSFRRAFGQLSKIVAAGKAIGATAMALTDTNTFGHISFYKQCKAAGIQPILGVELIVKKELTDDVKLTCLFYAATTAGLSELYGWTTLAATQGNAITFDDVNEMTDGIIVVAATQTDVGILGRADFIEVNPISSVQRKRARKLAIEHKLRVLPTSDVWYPKIEDRPTAELMGVAMKPTPQWMLSQMEATYHMPEIPLGVYIDSFATLKELTKDVELTKAENIRHPMNLEKACRKAIKSKVAEWNDEYEARLKLELKTIKSKKFDDYFAMLSGMCVDAKAKMLVGPARGSAAGSLVCYLLDITEIDPLIHDLMFERFIDETRYDFPDIDLDFPDDKRELVFEYLRKRYGAANVAHIGTVSRLKAKSAIGEVAKRLDIPPWETSAVKDAMIERSGGDARAAMCIMDTFESIEIGQEFIQKYPAMAKAADLEDHAWHSGVHAAGALVCNLPVRTYCTIDDEGVAQIDKKDAETINLMKVDVLGLRTLSLIETTGIDVRRVPLNDPVAFEVLSLGRFTGVFQFEGPALRSICNQIGVNDFEDIVAITSLARPGPLHSGGATTFVNRKLGKEKVESIHPIFDRLTAKTQGMVLYQEQVMQLLRQVGNMEWADVQLLRRAMSKSLGLEFFEQFFERFLTGARANDVDDKSARKIWDLMIHFGSYGFNRCIAEGTLIHLAQANRKIKGPAPIEKLYELYQENPSKFMRDNHSMPTLISIDESGKGHPQKAWRIFKNGIKSCLKLSFDDGSEVICTPDHKFIVEGEWSTAGSAKIGSAFASLEDDLQKFGFTGKGKGHNKGKHWKIGKDGDRTGEANPSFTNGAQAIFSTFKIANKGKPCEHCGCYAERMEAHHTDLNQGRDDPAGLEWLCVSCHKKAHYAAGRVKQNGKGKRQTSKILISVEDAGERMTYDIEMPENHNYMLGNGIVTHNSHAVAYAIISYWCAWLKGHYPLEFAMAALKHAKDDDQSIRLLREVVNEGSIEYIPFDKDNSQISWSIFNGKILGGLVSIKGVGEKKAQTLIEKRAAGTLSKKDLELLEDPPLMYKDLFPARRQFGHMYDDPRGNGISTDKVYTVKEVNDQMTGSICVIAKLNAKDIRSRNETQALARRKGKLVPKNKEFWLSMEFEDDTDKILGTVSFFDYAQIAPQFLNAPTESYWLLRCDMQKGWRRLNIKKARKLT
jgi:hypothetical protein